MEKNLLNLLLQRMVDVSADVSTLTVSLLGRLMPKMSSHSISTIIVTLARLLVSEEAARPEGDAVIINADGSQNRPVYDAYIQALRQVIVHSNPALLGGLLTSTLPLLQQSLAMPPRSSKQIDRETRDNISMGISAVLTTLIPAVPAQVWPDHAGSLDRIASLLLGLLDSDREPLRVHAAQALGTILSVCLNETIGHTLEELCKAFTSRYHAVLKDPLATVHPDSYLKALAAFIDRSSPGRVAPFAAKLIDTFTAVLPAQPTADVLRATKTTRTVDVYNQEVTAAIQALWSDVLNCLTTIIRLDHFAIAADTQRISKIVQSAAGLAAYDPYYEYSGDAENECSRSHPADDGVDMSEWGIDGSSSTAVEWGAGDDGWGMSFLSLNSDHGEAVTASQATNSLEGVGTGPKEVGLFVPNDCSRLVRMQAIELAEAVVVHAPRFTTRCYSDLLAHFIALLREHDATVLAKVIGLLGTLISHASEEIPAPISFHPPAFVATLHRWLAFSPPDMSENERTVQPSTGVESASEGRVIGSHDGHSKEVPSILAPELQHLNHALTLLEDKVTTDATVVASAVYDIITDLIRIVSYPGAFGCAGQSIVDYAAEILPLALRIIAKAASPAASRCLETLLKHMPIACQAASADALVDAYVALVRNSRCSETSVHLFPYLLPALRYKDTKIELSDRLKLLTQALAATRRVVTNSELSESHRLEAIQALGMGLVTCDIGISSDQFQMVPKALGVGQRFQTVSTRTQRGLVLSDADAAFESECVAAVADLFDLLQQFIGLGAAPHIRAGINTLESLALIGSGLSPELLALGAQRCDVPVLLQVLQNCYSRPNLQLSASALKVLICLVAANVNILNHVHQSTSPTTPIKPTDEVLTACNVFRAVWGVWINDKSFSSFDIARTTLLPCNLAQALVALVLRRSNAKLSSNPEAADLICKIVISVTHLQLSLEASTLTAPETSITTTASSKYRQLTASHHLAHNSQDLLVEPLNTLYWLLAWASSHTSDDQMEPLSRKLSQSVLRGYEEHYQRSLSVSESNPGVAEACAATIGICLGGIVQGLPKEKASSSLAVTSALLKAACEAIGSKSGTEEAATDNSTSTTASTLQATSLTVPDSVLKLIRPEQYCIDYSTLLSSPLAFVKSAESMVLLTSQLLYQVGTHYLAQVYTTGMFESFLEDCTRLSIAVRGRNRSLTSALVRLLGHIIQNGPDCFTSALSLLRRHVEQRKIVEANGGVADPVSAAQHRLLLTSITECLIQCGRMATQLPEVSDAPEPSEKTLGSRISSYFVDNIDLFLSAVPATFEIACMHFSLPSPTSRELVQHASALISALFMISPRTLRALIDKEFEVFKSVEMPSLRAVVDATSPVTNSIWESKSGASTTADDFVDKVLTDLSIKAASLSPAQAARLAQCGAATLRAAALDITAAEDRMLSQVGSTRTRLTLAPLPRKDLYTEMTKIMAYAPLILALNEVSAAEQVIASLSHLLTVPQSTATQAVLRDRSTWGYVVASVLRHSAVRPELIQKHTAGSAVHYADVGIDLRLSVCMFADRLLGLVMSDTPNKNILAHFIPVPATLCKSLVNMLKDYAPDHSVEVIKRGCALIVQAAQIAALESYVVSNIATVFSEALLPTLKHHYQIVRTDVRRREEAFKEENAKYEKGIAPRPVMEDPTPECSASLEMLRANVSACMALNVLSGVDQIPSFVYLWNEVIMASQHTKQLVIEMKNAT